MSNFNRRNNFFKVMDPILQKDINRTLIYLWVFWMTVQAGFIYFLNTLFYSDSNPEFIWAITTGFLLFSSLLFLVISLFINRFLHKITGPLYRIRSDLEQLNNQPQENKTIVLRQGDYFQDLVDQINKVIETRKS